MSGESVAPHILFSTFQTVCPCLVKYTIPIIFLLSCLFGLHHAFSPLQHPIRHASASLLDFILPSPRFNVQSATLQLPFWTSSYLLPASTSNPPRFSFPFGLHHAFSPLQRPIRHASASLLDFITPSPRFNVQSTTLRLPFWTSLCLPYTLKSTHFQMSLRHLETLAE